MLLEGRRDMELQSRTVYVKLLGSLLGKIIQTFGISLMMHWVSWEPSLNMRLSVMQVLWMMILLLTTENCWSRRTKIKKRLLFIPLSGITHVMTGASSSQLPLFQSQYGLLVERNSLFLCLCLYLNRSPRMMT